MYNRLLQLLRDNNVQEFEELLTDNANFNLEETDSEERTLLHWAIIENRIDIVRVLVNAGSNIGAESNEGKNALYYISEILENWGQFFELIDQQHPINNVDEAVNNPVHRHAAQALYHASEHGSLQTVTRLMTQYPGVLNGIALAADNALLIAAEHGHLSLVQYFLNNQLASIDVQNEEGNNALLLAILGGHYPVVDFLLQNLSVFLLQAGQGNNPLELLGRSNQLDEGPLECIIASNVLSENRESCIQMVKLLVNYYAQQIGDSNELAVWLKPLLQRGFIDDNALPPEAIDFIIARCPNLLIHVQQSPSITQGINTITQQLSAIHIAPIPPPPNESGLYLYVTTEPGVTPLISMTPINSSGDIYHVLAYIILALSHQKQVPKTYLTYDGDARLLNTLSSAERNTYTQANISYRFAAHLGYQQYFHNALLEIPKINNSSHQNPRQTALERVLGQTENILYIDQRGLTTLIAYHFKRLGWEDTTRRIREGFSHHEGLPAPVLQEIDRRVAAEMNRINAHRGQAPLILLHVRHSKNANNNQAIEGTFLVPLRNYLVTTGYRVWFVFTDGRTRKSYDIDALREQRTDPFPCNIDNADYGKIFHLRLLLALYSLQNNLHIIGNTSGTLDVAAFMGHRVFNLHDFQNKLSYQSYRILIQSAFLSIQQFDDSLANTLSAGGLTNEAFNRIFPQICRWLGNSTIHIFPIENFSRRRLAAVNPNEANYSELFYAQAFIHQRVSPRPLLGATQNIETLVAGGYYQHYLNLIIWHLQALAVGSFQQTLAEALREGFDINLLDQNHQRTLLQWALTIAVKCIENYQDRTKILIIIDYLLNQGASLSTLSGNYLLRITSERAPDRANALRLQILTLFSQYYHHQTLSPLQFPGYNIAHPIATDGNCLFASIAHQLQTRYQRIQNIDHLSLRRMAVDHMRSRLAEYSGFMGNNANHYLSNLARVGEWGGEPEIRALADTLNITITVIRPHGQPPLIYGTNREVNIHIGFNGINHYHSLLPNPQPTHQEARQERPVGVQEAPLPVNATTQFPLPPVTHHQTQIPPPPNNGEDGIPPPKN